MIFLFSNGANELLIGSVAKEGNNREKMFIITKFANRWTEGQPGWVVDGSPEYVRKAIDASIERLGSAPDAWAMHRIDPKVPIEETVTAMEEARQAGKCKFLGLSEVRFSASNLLFVCRLTFPSACLPSFILQCSVATLRRANAVARIDFIEVEFSPWTLDMESNGILAVCEELKIVVLAYSPLGRGFLTGRFTSPSDFAVEGDYRSMLPRLQKEVWEKNFRIVTAFQTLAAQKGCTSSQLCLAWGMQMGSHIIPIPGVSSFFLFLSFSALFLENILMLFFH